jgi:hypothetical protein
MMASAYTYATNAAVAQIAAALRRQHATTAEAIAGMIDAMPEKPNRAALTDLIREAAEPRGRRLTLTSRARARMLPG